MVDVNVGVASESGLGSMGTGSLDASAGTVSTDLGLSDSSAAAVVADDGGACLSGDSRSISIIAGPPVSPVLISESCKCAFIFSAFSI